MDPSGRGGVSVEKSLLALEVTNMSDIDKAGPHGCDNGALTDRFGVLIQGLLAVVAFSTLMRECLLCPCCVSVVADGPRGVLLTFEQRGSDPNSTYL